MGSLELAEDDVEFGLAEWLQASLQFRTLLTTGLSKIQAAWSGYAGLSSNRAEKT